MARQSRPSVNFIKGAVEEEDVDAGFAEDVEVAVVGVGGDEGGDGGGREAAGFGNAGDLELGVGQADVGIEAAGGGGDGVGGSRDGPRGRRRGTGSEGIK